MQSDFFYKNYNFPENWFLYFRIRSTSSQNITSKAHETFAQSNAMKTRLQNSTNQIHAYMKMMSISGFTY